MGLWNVCVRRGGSQTIEAKETGRNPRGKALASTTKSLAALSPVVRITTKGNKRVWNGFQKIPQKVGRNEAGRLSVVGCVVVVVPKIRSMKNSGHNLTCGVLQPYVLLFRGRLNHSQSVVWLKLPSHQCIGVGLCTIVYYYVLLCTIV